MSTTATGAQASGPSAQPSVSGNGLVIAFHSEADDLVPGDTNGVRDVFVKAITGAIFLASVANDGVTQGSASSSRPRLDASGTVVAFTSTSPEFGDDTGAATRAIVRDGLRETTTVVSRLIPVGVSSPVTITGSGFRTGTTTQVSTNPVTPGADGVVFDNVVVVDDTTITAEISVIGGVASPGPRNIIVQQNGFRGSMTSCACLTVVP